MRWPWVQSTSRRGLVLLPHVRGFGAVPVRGCLAGRAGLVAADRGGGWAFLAVVLSVAAFGAALRLTRAGDAGMRRGVAGGETLLHGLVQLLSLRIRRVPVG